MEYSIVTIEDYPDNGKHQECVIDLPFEIRKGEDGYVYWDEKGEEKKYNLSDKIDERWIVNLTDEASYSLKEMFKIKCHKDLNLILLYCLKLYLKSLELEIKRINAEKVKWTNYLLKFEN